MLFGELAFISVHKVLDNAVPLVAFFVGLDDSVVLPVGDDLFSVGQGTAEVSTLPVVLPETKQLGLVWAIVN